MLFDRWRQRILPWHIGATWRILLNLCILRPTRVHNRNGKWISSAVFAQLTAESAYTVQYQPELPLPTGDLDLSCNTWCFWPMRAHNPNAPRSVQPSLHRWPTSVSILYNGLPVSPLKIALSYVGIWTSCNTWFIGPTQVRNANGNFIVSAVFAGLTGVTDRQTDRQTDMPRYSVRCGVIMRNYVGYDKATQSFHVSTNNFATIKSLSVRLKHLTKYIV